MSRTGLLVLMLLLASGAPGQAETLRLAVASNFSPVMKSLAPLYERQSGDELVMAFGATGRHYAQIHHGAPFDVFLAADAQRPQRLESEGQAVSGSRISYARGRLVLWSREPDRIRSAEASLSEPGFRFLAIANPTLAPYGRAAREVLEALGYWQSLQGRLVRGENIAQTYQFVRSGNAELGLVALSQLRSQSDECPGSCWTVPEHLHAPIDQQAILVREGAAGRRFLEFLAGSEAQAIIERHGYVPAVSGLP